MLSDERRDKAKGNKHKNKQIYPRFSRDKLNYVIVCRDVLLQ